jgi:2,4-dienoyl-CoA reductase-like NADH-dependent reductase (Old Yellow Enzyme family)
MLQFFSASTSIVNSKRAITECIENALEGEPNLDCDLIIIYTAMGHNFKDILSEARMISPNAQVVGCTCGGIIGKDGPDESMKALAIMAIKGPRDEFFVTGTDTLDRVEVFETFSQLALDMKEHNPGINMILCHPGVSSQTRVTIRTKIIEGIESVFGPDIPIIGGLSTDNNKLISNFQFLGEQVFEQGAIMIGFADPTIELIALGSHGYDVIGKPFTVTQAEDHHIIELDGRPPWKSWTERLGMLETSKPMEVMVLSPLATELPADLHEEYGSPYLVNAILPVVDGSLYATRPIPEGTKLWLTRRNENNILDSVDRMMIQILDRCQGRKPVAVFHADCVARGKVLFNRIMKDEIISRLQYPLCKDENIPWLGMYGGSEITTLGGRNVIQAYTTSLYVIVKRKSKFKQEKVPLKTEMVESSGLFDSTTIGNISLKNHFICSATWLGKANHDGSCSPGLISSLLPIARGETGMLISEMAHVSANAQCAPFQMGVYDDSLLPGLKRMADFVHKAGSPVVMQLVHGGLFSIPLMYTGQEPLGPSVMTTPDGPVGREMTKEEILETVGAFKEAAVRAQKAGFDGVQIHAAHGWLLSQFLSPFFNRRNDEYGGNIENRARIVLEITRNIREAVGDQFPVLVKINSDDFLEGGFNTDEMLQVSVMLEKSGVNAIELSGGTIAGFLSGNLDVSFSPTGRKDVYYSDAAKRLKEKIKIPLILVGGIRSFETADKLVKEGTADYISLCRPLIREPGLISRWKSGDLRKSACISDSACFQPGMDGKGVHCVHTQNEYS